MVLYALFVLCIIGFFTYYVVCELSDECEFQGSNTIALPLAILNFVVWVMLLYATCTFVHMLNKRFGEQEFSGPKCKLRTFLSVFSLSFFVRGSWDFFTSPFIFGTPLASDATMAALIFFLYFLTEVVPIFVIYFMHVKAFLAIIRR